MANFTVRVELHDADDEDYERLHEFMSDQGFERTVVGNDNVKYALPPAEYVLVNVQFTMSKVLEKAKLAASETAKRHAVFVTSMGSEGWTAYGLERIRLRN